jgi:hypothetical protein
VSPISRYRIMGGENCCGFLNDVVKCHRSSVSSRKSSSNSYSRHNNISSKIIALKISATTACAANKFVGC